MGFMVLGGEYHEARNDFNWLEQKNPSFTRLTCSENINWETESMCISGAKYATRKETGRVNALLKGWRRSNYPIYHVERFHTYMELSNKMDPDVSECAKW